MILFKIKQKIKWEFRDDTWKILYIMYNPMPIPFFGLGRGPSFIYNLLSTFITLFELFWTPIIMDAIVREINRYAMALDALGRTRGGPDWEDLSIGGLKAFMAIALYMGMKKQQNKKNLLDEEFLLSLL